MNTTSIEPKKLKQVRTAIYIASVAIPLVVAVLFGMPKVKGFDSHFLPPIYAGINGLTAILLVSALLAIKKKNMKIHRMFIRMSLLLSLIFLACYVTYHLTSEATIYGGSMRGLYLFILITHILLSVAVIPIVLFTYLFAWEGNYTKHKKWTRYAWPIWMYVAVTGVIVYLMISHY